MSEIRVVVTIATEAGEILRKATLIDDSFLAQFRKPHQLADAAMMALEDMVDVDFQEEFAANRATR